MSQRPAAHAQHITTALADPASLATIPTRRRDGRINGRRTETKSGLTRSEEKWVELVSDGTDDQAAYRIAYPNVRSDGSVSTGVRRLRKRPQVQAAMMIAARSALANGSLKAAKRLVDLTTDAKSEYVQADAAKSVLDRAGITAKPDGQGGGSGGQVTININLGDGKGVRIGAQQDKNASQPDLSITLDNQPD